MAANPDTLAVDKNAFFINPSLGLFFGYVLLFGDDGEEALSFLAMFDGKRSFLHDRLRKIETVPECGDACKTFSVYRLLGDWKVCKGLEEMKVGFNLFAIDADSILSRGV